MFIGLIVKKRLKNKGRIGLVARLGAGTGGESRRGNLSRKGKRGKKRQEETSATAEARLPDAGKRLEQRLEQERFRSRWGCLISKATGDD